MRMIPPSKSATSLLLVVICVLLCLRFQQLHTFQHLFRHLVFVMSLCDCIGAVAQHIAASIRVAGQHSQCGAQTSAACVKALPLKFCFLQSGNDHMLTVLTKVTLREQPNPITALLFP